ncbi:hypothetical protein QNI19_07545 [Cytophagaceae bacterium DM2B3-1]|uniref:Uncharacterized protein n=1 Tax=Xanthocytophaga flava TaxID=3048013 RepID=A0ABT7CGA8_9BACT|nr:hypothetical protein [Xanthocytophaga flavus]MDJ1492781.1 hypothetical protein [Xanthocytophaga flavus]
MKQSFSLNVLPAIIALALATSACTSSLISQKTSVNPTTIVKQEPVTIDSEHVIAAGAQTSQEDPTFSASEIYTKATQSTTEKKEELLADATTTTKQVDIQSLREQLKHQKMGFAKKAMVKAVLKKVEKMQAKSPEKQLKAKKMGGVPEEYRIPFIIGAIGLGLIIIAALAGGAGAIYTLGALALVGAIVWVILILAEVI